MYNQRGFYSPLSIDETLFVYLDKPTQAAWKKVQDLQGKWRSAKDAMTELEAAAQAAPQHDQQAALDAVAAGKPAPKETVTACNEAVVAQQREVDALVTLADAAERVFLSELQGQRQMVADQARGALERAITQLIDECAKAQEELTHAYRVNGLWQWGRGAYDAQTPSDQRITAPVNSHMQDLRQVLGMVTEALTKALPDAVEDQEANLAAWNAQLRGAGATSDGLILDAAAYRAYR